MSTTPIQLPALKPPEYYSPFDARTKLMNLQNLAQQQQEGQQRMQVNDLAVQEHQRALEQRKAIDEAYKNAWTIGADGRPQLDKGRFTQALSTAGHGSAATGILEGYTNYEKSLAGLQETKGKVAAAERDAAGAFGSAAQSADYDPHVFLNLMHSAVNNEALTPDHVQPFVDDVTAALGYDPSGQVARGLVKKYTDLMIAGSTKQQELATSRKTSESTVTRNAAQAGAADVNSLKGRLEIAGQTAPIPADPQAPVDPQAWTEWRDKQKDDVKAYIPPTPSPAGVALVKQLGLTMNERRQGEQAAATLAQNKVPNTETELAIVAKDPKRTPEERAAAEAALKRLDQSRLASRPVVNNLIPGVPTAPATGAAADLHGEDYLKTLPPAIAARLRQMGSGDITAPTGRAATTGAGGQIMNALMQYDPTFNERRAAIRKAFTTGPDGRNIGNLNTAPVHLDQLYDAAMAMKNGSFQPGNEVWNRLSTMFGSSMPTNFDALKVTVSGEMANALKGVATDPEIAHINETLNRAKSPGQLAGVIETNLESIAGKLNTYQERAQQQDVGKWSPVLPSAGEVFKRHGIDPVTLKKAGASGAGGGAGPAGTIAVPLKSGRTAYMAPDAAAKFKTEHPELVK